MRTGRTSQFHPLGQLRDEIDRLFSDCVGGLPSLAPPPFISGRGFPAVNLWETADDVFAEAEVPGLAADDVEISVVGRELTLKGKRQTIEAEGFAFHRRERGVGAFARILKLPVDVDSAKVNASLENGVLLVSMPKADAAKPRKIAVQVSS